MARGAAVKEFIGKFRGCFYTQLSEGETDYPQPDMEYGGTVIGLAFERAVNDTLLGNGSEPKPAAKPRKKRQSRKTLPTGSGTTANHGIPVGSGTATNPGGE